MKNQLLGGIVSGIGLTVGSVLAIWAINKWGAGQQIGAPEQEATAFEAALDAATPAGFSV